MYHSAFFEIYWRCFKLTLGNAESTSRMRIFFLWIFMQTELPRASQTSCGKGEKEAETIFACSTLEVASLKSFGLSPGAADFSP